MQKDKKKMDIFYIQLLDIFNSPTLFLKNETSLTYKSCYNWINIINNVTIIMWKNRVQ